MVTELNIKRYSEAELVKALIEKDTGAFTYLYNNYSSALFKVITGIISDLLEAANILQDVFIKIWKGIDKYDALKGRLFTWMLSIVKNVTIDTLRSKNQQQQKITVELDKISFLPNTEINPYLKFETADLKKAILKLKPNLRVLIELNYLYGYTQTEIARLLKIPLGTVKTRIRKANEDLKELLSSSYLKPTTSLLQKFV
jgi:RNA polymerase sigma-70 factor (ECF subfamily)